ncbi:hypothetical protein ABZ990_16505 [Streptomyces sp. NPDC046203]|uniref:hypothetical protein n=1 Tax=Streptomyces sp. NPDC046203 TaxID=3154602 RepID=UPI0033D6A170
MYGQGFPPATPPQRQRGVPASVIVLRVLFALLPLLSLGLLTWGTALRIALMTRRVLDWVLFVLSVVVVVVAIVLMPDENDTSLTGDLIVGAMLLCAVAFTAYFLVVDMRQGGRQRPRRADVRPGFAPAEPYNPYAQTVPQGHFPQQAPQAPQAQQLPPHQPHPFHHLQTQPGYGYPQPHPQPTAAPPGTPPGTPPPTAPPTPSTARIDQVRAELDELSDLLRKDEGGGR